MEENKKHLKKLYVFATVQDNRYLLEYRELDEQGRITMEIAFYPDGSVYEKVAHSYIEDKVLQSNYFSENDEVSHSVSFSYGEDDYMDEESTWYADGSLTIKTFIRDKEKQDETIIIKDENGKIEGKEYYQYNEKYIPILHIKYDEKGEEIEEKIAYSYNKDGYMTQINAKMEGEADFKRSFDYKKNDEGNIIESYTKNHAGEIVASEVRSYTDNKKPASLEETDRMTKQYKKTTWEYDENGNNTVIQQFNARGDLNMEILVEYNDKNQIVIEETRSSNTGVSLKEYVYEYGSLLNDVVDE
ncbi:MAG: hypothetical protein ACI94Y_002235 [Maribacter sp.]|jgi:hypothetical protein